VTLVEVYNHRVYQPLRVVNRSNCGGGPVIRSFGPQGRELRTYRQPNPTTVAYIFVWTK